MTDNSINTATRGRRDEHRGRRRPAGGPQPRPQGIDLPRDDLITLFFVAPILYMVIGSLKPADKVLNGLSGFKPEPLPAQLHRRL